MNEPTVDTIVGPNLRQDYELMLEDSINFFLKEFCRGGSDFSAFHSNFYRLLQTMADPPLEILCFYLAMSYHRFKAIFQDPSQNLLVTKELFHLVHSCLAPCNALKKVSALAPIIYVLHNSVISLSETDLCLGRQIESLVEKVVSYISMCCPLEEQREGFDKLTLRFLDLIGVWMVDRVEASCNLVDHLRVFFPLLSDEVRLKINVGYRMDYLAGVVMNEIFLLMLELKLGLGVWGDNLRRDMGDWAMQTIKGFQNFIFFDMLLRMMLEPSLPVTTLLSSEEEVFLRKVLYDSVLLGEFPFLKSGRSTQLPGNDLINMSLVWLLVADNAIQFVREHGEHATAISYIEAFSKADFPNLLVKWFTNQTGMEEKLGRPYTPTPRALIKWLLVLEDQGIIVFSEDVFKLHAKAEIYNSGVNYALPALKPADENTFFDLENGVNGGNKVSGDQEMVHLPASACLVNPTNQHGRRKREEEMTGEATRNKIVKLNFHENSVSEKFLPFVLSDALISGSEVNTPAHRNEMETTVRDDGDEDMEDMG